VTRALIAIVVPAVALGTALLTVRLVDGSPFGPRAVHTKVTTGPPGSRGSGSQPDASTPAPASQSAPGGHPLVDQRTASPRTVPASAAVGPTTAGPNGDPPTPPPLGAAGAGGPLAGSPGHDAGVIDATAAPARDATSPAGAQDQRDPARAVPAAAGPPVKSTVVGDLTSTGASGTVLVTGQATPNGSVTVNGQHVDVGTNGQFSAAVPARAGRTTVTVTASNPTGPVMASNTVVVGG